MRTLDPITPEMAEHIQSLIDHTKAMTPERLKVLLLESDTLTREEAIAGFAHIFRIAEFALRLVIDDDGDPEEPAIEIESDQYRCAICFATTYDFEAGWHRESCQWAQMVDVIKGTPPAE